MQVVIRFIRFIRLIRPPTVWVVTVIGQMGRNDFALLEREAPHHR